MDIMTQQPGESPLPDAVPLDGIAPTPPSLAVRVQSDEPISTGHATTALDSANIDRLRRVAALSRAICGLGAALGPVEKLRAANRIQWLVTHPDELSENVGT
ncbi:hypothetical protein QYH69_07780 [Paraburkholderia sp. SARCC-3016]|uniref:hypothetical protein n=1 Tax=Paraburkholderia sp. SARCC-3016 TaxID=3058611 RepID=UPI002806F007|nr:hypothetical protein [Paraburkholderia sp. SARCC-3016]MDQ7977145.1 hypothetical protein [Paraburkholderia sp. SARCC-3016]